LAKQVKRAIENYIEDNNLKPGDRLPPEPELCMLFGVSRTALREGMRVLEMMGVISIEPGRGSFIRSFDIGQILANLPARLVFQKDDIRQIADVRRYLERYSIERAAQAAITDPDQPLFAELAYCLRHMKERAEKGEDLWAEDIAFHRTIALLADNRVLLMILELFWDLRARFPRYDTSETLLARYRRHKQLASAVMTGNVAEAIAINEELYRLSLQELEASEAGSRVKPAADKP